MAAYSIDLTTGALTKNGVVTANLLDLEVALRFDSNPGPIEGVAGSTVIGFTIKGSVHDVAADARLLQQGPPGLLGANVKAFAGTPSRYKFESAVGDTLAITNVPVAPIVAAPLVSPYLAIANP